MLYLLLRVGYWTISLGKELDALVQEANPIIGRPELVRIVLVGRAISRLKVKQLQILDPVAHPSSLLKVVTNQELEVQIECVGI